MDGDLGPIEGFIESFNRNARPLYTVMSEALWQASLTGRKEDEQEAARTETEFRKLYNSPVDLRRLREAEPAASSGALPPATARQVRVLINEFTSNQMDPVLLEETVRRQKAIETTFNTFRARVGNEALTANQISQVLKESQDSGERRSSWEASKEIGRAVSPPLLELVAIRNRIARDLGYPDFYQMSLSLQELTVEELTGICDRFEELSSGPFRVLRQEMDAVLAPRFRVTPEELRPWHYADPFFQEAPATGSVDLDPIFAARSCEELAEGFYSGIGLPVDDVLRRSDLYEKPGKDQHAYCIHLDREGDVRILCNLRPTARWNGTLLHECGHAVYDKYIDSGLPFTLRTPAHTFATEAIANLMGRQVRELGWLKARAGIGAEQAKALAGEVPGILRAQMLISTRWMLVMIHFEREMYRDPAQDLDRLWWDLVERYQFVRRPESRKAPDWASKIHLACFPVYYHNYLLGEFMASQVRRWIDREVLSGGSDTLDGHPEVGRYLRKEIFSPGGLLRWDDLLRRATGESLNPEHFVRQFV
jgi:peptidyl-dipeptidase A